MEEAPRPTPAPVEGLSLKSSGRDKRSTSPKQRSEIKLEVCSEVVAKLRESNHEVLEEPGFVEELQNHFNRLPTRYALDVNTERAEDVIIHKKLLKLATEKEKPPFFYVRPVHIFPTAELAGLANSDESHIQPNDSGFLTSVNRSLMKASIHPPSFGSSTNLEALGLESSPKPMAIDEGSERSSLKRQLSHIPLHEITFATVDRPKLLSQLSAVLADSGLNIREAHVFSTNDGYSLDCFLVDGWDSEEVEGIQDALTSHLNSIENAAWNKPPASPIQSPAPPDPVVQTSAPSQHVRIPSNGVDDWEIDSKHLKLSHKVASGSFGDLFRGTYCGQDVAIKILKPERLSDTLQQEFAQEVFIMRKVRHKNVVQFIGACTKPPNLSIVTEFMSGGSVYDYLHKQKGTMKLTTLLKIACDVAKGMDFLHKNNIIHRDLKAANLLMDENEVVKIADFGVARIQAQSGVMTAETGTYRWMAPEVIEHRPYDHKADVFSYGIVLWELLTGKLPYNDLTPLQAAVSVVQRGLRPTIPSKTHPSLANLMERCWKSNPSERPEFSEIVKILQKILKEVEDESNVDSKQSDGKKSSFFSSLRRPGSTSKQ